jgi:hypothetical protein
MLLRTFSCTVEGCGKCVSLDLDLCICGHIQAWKKHFACTFQTIGEILFIKQLKSLNHNLCKVKKESLKGKMENHPETN